MDAYSPSGTLGRRPQASWVMGRSARWHSAEGQALLAETAVHEDVQRLRSNLSAQPFLEPPSLGSVLSLTARLARLVPRRWSRR